MELRQLKYFTAAADHKNFTKAATLLFVSQSAISQQISALEEELGVQLFIRDTHSVRLTMAGAELYKHTQQILSFVDSAVASTQTADQAQHYAARMGIGVQKSIALNTSLGPFLDAVQATQKAYPFVVFDVIEIEGSQVEKALYSGEVDIVIALNPLELEAAADRRTKTKMLVSEKHLLAVAKRRLEMDFGNEKPATKDILMKYPINLVRGRSMHVSRISAIYKQYDLRPNVEYYDSTIETHFRTCFGYGMCLIPEARVYDLGKMELLEFFELELDSAWNSRNLVWLDKNMSGPKKYLLERLGMI